MLHLKGHLQAIQHDKYGHESFKESAFDEVNPPMLNVTGFAVEEQSVNSVLHALCAH